MLLLCASLAGQKKKKTAAATVAPDAVPHAFAQLLRTMSKDGSRAVTFKATAIGTRFFFEETNGVTVYRFEKGSYVKVEFLRGSTLSRAVKKYAK
jgi:hypothetical protein